MTTETLDLKDDMELEEAFLVKRDLWRFLDYVEIPDPPPAGTGIVKFEKWPHILKLHQSVEAVPKGGVLPCLKARKLGVTSYFEARFLWQAQYQLNSFLPVLSQGEIEAAKVIADCLYIWEHLPAYLKVPLLQNNTTTLKFKDGGTIQAFPSTAKAGRSYTGTEILMDEADFHDAFGINYDALLPLIGDTGGKLFAVSTANPDLVDSEFRRVYRQSPNSVFLGYFDRPGRTQEGYEAAKGQSSELQRFEKENARTETEALKAPSVMAYFDAEAVDVLAQGTEKPREFDKGGLVWIWKRPLIGLRYIFFGDVAWGEKGAYSCVPFVNYQTLEQVTEIYGRPPLDELALWIVDTAKSLNSAYGSVEANGEGITVVNKMIELGYGNRMYHRKDDWRDNPKSRGWGTDQFTRPIMLEKLAQFIQRRQIVPKCKDATNEFATFVRTEKAGKLRPEASVGAYADHVMAWAGLLQIHERAVFSTSGPPVRVTYAWKK